MPGNHALLSPSSAHRWLVCTPCAVLESTLPEQTSPYAEEGTKAHSLAEMKLRRKLLGITGLRKPKDTDPEMDEATDFYLNFVTEELNAARSKTPDADLYVEQTFDLTDYIPDAFGTSDAVIVSDELLEVIDLKYGKGVMVNAEENPQLMLYTLGAALHYDGIYDFDNVRCSIVQPRLNHVSTYDLPLDKLMDWAENYIKPQAALAFKGEGEYVTGEHCRFCKAAGICRKRVTEAFDVIAHSAEPTLSDEEIESILPRLGPAKEWIDSIWAYVESKASNEGFKWKGYKVVESGTKRKISDEIKVLKAITDAGFDLEDVTTLKLNGLTSLQKTLGKAKFEELVGPFIVKPEGKPTLVPESDKREEINTLQEVFKED